MKLLPKNLKDLQNLPNTLVGRSLSAMTLFGGRSCLPRFVELLLTYRCNLKCTFCYQSPKKRKSFNDLTLGDARTIEANIRQAYTFKPRIHFFGGEPAVNADFPAILEVFSGGGYRCSMTTNGLALDTLAAARPVRGLREINVSLNIQDRGRLLATLKRFREHYAGERVYVNCTCPIRPDNQSGLLDVAEEVAASSADCLTIQHTFFTARYTTPMDGAAVRGEVESIRARRWRMPVLFFPSIRVKDIEAYYSDPAFPHGHNSCVFPWYALFIQPNGDVIPCDEMDIPVGNLLREDLRAVWNGRRFRAFRKDLRQRGLTHAICWRCCHRRYY